MLFIKGSMEFLSTEMGSYTMEMQVIIQIYEMTIMPFTKNKTKQQIMVEGRIQPQNLTVWTHGD